MEQINFKTKIKIEKKDCEKRQAFGWASISIKSNGAELVDWQNDSIDEAELEHAAYEFVRNYASAGEMHERGGVGELIESIVFTAEKQERLGIPKGTLPIGWWVGFQVTDDNVWQKVKDGTYSMFSIEGTAERIPDGE